MVDHRSRAGLSGCGYMSGAPYPTRLETRLWHFIWTLAQTTAWVPGPCGHPYKGGMYELPPLSTPPLGITSELRDPSFIDVYTPHSENKYRIAASSRLACTVDPSACQVEHDGSFMLQTISYTGCVHVNNNC